MKTWKPLDEDKILKIIVDEGIVTAGHVSKILKVHPNTAKKTLEKLVNDKKVDKFQYMPNPNKKYVITLFKSIEVKNESNDTDNKTQ